MVADVSALYLIRVGDRSFVRRGTPAAVAGKALHAVKFNPSHDAQGRFARRQGAQAVAVRAAEDRIADSPVERAVAIDAHGRTVLDTEGAESHVDFRGATVKDCVLTHNHPGGSGLNIGDIETAMRTDVAQVRAVTKQYRHSLDRPSEGWPQDAEARRRVRDLYDHAEQRQYQIFYERIRRGEMSETEAESQHHHAVVARVAGQLGWTYKREQR